MRTAEQLREDLLAIWWAGVDAVRPARLVADSIRCENRTLYVQDESISLENVKRIVVVGAGKGAGEMAAALETVLAPPDQTPTLQVEGWVNVPDDCVRPLRFIHLHGARPAGVNEPTENGVYGTGRIVKLLETLAENDLCIVLFTGGGSALLPAPIPAISLSEKVALTKALSASGMNIEQINTVRKEFSTLKGGKLLDHCVGKRVISLILSDVPGDKLDVIASGPTVPTTSSAEDALSVMRHYGLDNMFPRLCDYLADVSRIAEPPKQHHLCKNFVIGNNAVAVNEAGIEAKRRGYSHVMFSSPDNEGFADDVGKDFAEVAISMLRSGRDCFISGGEPVVALAPLENRGKGGRNQQVTLAALYFLMQCRELGDPKETPWGIAFLSGGTDGEDGPTDAAGAMFDDLSFCTINKMPDLAEIKDALIRNDAYSFFERHGGLLKTGPTGTNVCDIRVILVSRIEQGATEV